eukprot:TRINITY_DN48382_c0_g1_i1.p1 TRINITY_DN48382_c0_g1~~TRINITY_DN48382_c0_g1_i1.p1  ORF type:complete len:959 (+),score=208.00 TRINITY_DN48382_c0_g1_i1:88-2877(+)
MAASTPAGDDLAALLNAADVAPDWPDSPVWAYMECHADFARPLLDSLRSLSRHHAEAWSLQRRTRRTSGAKATAKNRAVKLAEDYNRELQLLGHALVELLCTLERLGVGGGSGGNACDDAAGRPPARVMRLRGDVMLQLGAAARSLSAYLEALNTRAGLQKRRSRGSSATDGRNGDANSAQQRSSSSGGVTSDLSRPEMLALVDDRMAKVAGYPPFGGPPAPPTQSAAGYPLSRPGTAQFPSVPPPLPPARSSPPPEVTGRRHRRASRGSNKGEGSKAGSGGGRRSVGGDGNRTKNGGANNTVRREGKADASRQAAEKAKMHLAQLQATHEGPEAAREAILRELLRQACLEGCQASSPPRHGAYAEVFQSSEAAQEVVSRSQASPTADANGAVDGGTAGCANADTTRVVTAVPCPPPPLPYLSVDPTPPQEPEPMLRMTPPSSPGLAALQPSVELLMTPPASPRAAVPLAYASTSPSGKTSTREAMVTEDMRLYASPSLAAEGNGDGGGKVALSEAGLSTHSPQPTVSVAWSGVSRSPSLAAEIYGTEDSLPGSPSVDWLLAPPRAAMKQLPPHLAQFFTGGSMVQAEDAEADAWGAVVSAIAEGDDTKTSEALDAVVAAITMRQEESETLSPQEMVVNFVAESTASAAIATATAAEAAAAAQADATESVDPCGSEGEASADDKGNSVQGGPEAVETEPLSVASAEEGEGARALASVITNADGAAECGVNIGERCRLGTDKSSLSATSVEPSPRQSSEERVAAEEVDTSSVRRHSTHPGRWAKVATPYTGLVQHRTPTAQITVQKDIPPPQRRLTFPGAIHDIEPTATAKKCLAANANRSSLDWRQKDPEKDEDLEEDFHDPDKHKFDIADLRRRPHGPWSPPEGVNPRIRERYLTDDDFQRLFGCDRPTFDSQPKWRQQAKKKELGLF